MRIIGGGTKGRSVAHDRSGDLRPTSAKVRESLFNILRNRIESARFMDLFAGTGAVGFEALSRGARSVTFVEADPKRTGAIRRTAEQFGLIHHVEIICADTLAYLSRLSGGGPYDIIFADPPYRYQQFEELLELIYNKHILIEGGVVIIEHAAKKVLRAPEHGLRFVRKYRYGDTVLSKFEGNADGA